MSRRDRLLRAVVRHQTYHHHNEKFLGLNSLCLGLMARGLDLVCKHMHHALVIAAQHCTCRVAVIPMDATHAAWRRLYPRMRQCPFLHAWSMIGPPLGTPGCEPWQYFLRLSTDQTHLDRSNAGSTTLKHDHDVGYATCVTIASRTWLRAMATLDRPHFSPEHEIQDAATSLLCGLGPVKQQ